jgi:hypothetical protein
VRVIAVVVLLLVACQGGEREATTAVLKETVDAIRPKQQIVLKLRIEDTALRDALEDQLVTQRVATVAGRGEGPGHLWLALDVGSTAEAVPRVQAILRELELFEKTSLEIRQAR